MVCDVDSEGRCVRHPFVQLKRRSRSGEWKALLESCPLCIIDGNQSSNSRSSDKRHERALAAVTSANKSRGSDTKRRPHSSPHPQAPMTHLANLRSVHVSPPPPPKVKFAEDEADFNDQQFEPEHGSNENPYVVSSSSLPPHPTSSDLCSLEDIRPVSKARMSTSGASVVSSSSTIHSTTSGLSVKSAPGAPAQLRVSALKSLPKYRASPKLMQQQQLSGAAATTMSMGTEFDDDDSDEDIDRRHKSRRRRSSNQRPDPEEFPCNEAPVMHVINREQGRRMSPSQNSRYGTNVVVATSANGYRDDDEVSAISFQSFQKGSGSLSEISSPPPNRSDNNARRRLQQELQGFEGDGFHLSETEHANEDDDNSEDIANNSGVNTNDYDSKGRCVKHPHIRLRKKKMLGRGWKVLMNACPDCCVDELRRIKLAESHRKNRVKGHCSNTSRPQESITILHSEIQNTSRPHNVSSKRAPPPSEGSDETESLTGSSSGSSDDPVETPRGTSLESFNGRSSIEDVASSYSSPKKNKEGIFVRCMQWADDKGRKGLYTGEVDSRFMPHGMGSMQYEDGSVREGEWRNGALRRLPSKHSNSKSKPSRSNGSSSTRKKDQNTSSRPKQYVC